MAHLEATNQQPKTLIVGIHAPYNATKSIESYYEEFRNLVRSNGISPDAELFVRARQVDAGHFLGSGTIEKILELCKKELIEQVVFSEPLTPTQERNLSALLKVRVIDRTLLILEIFERGAQSAEGKMQVELAMFQYQKSRLSGRGISMSQQAGRIGTRGPGETAKEKETQHLELLMQRIRRNLKHLEQVRETQRKQRMESELPRICIIGYTNAGKSTILNALTHSDVLAEDKLFATLDTTTRELFIDGKKKGLISDTVGFIQLLPHTLIEAFKSTLAELKYAHLLLHVVDASDANWQSHCAVVQKILAEIGAQNIPVLYVFNKIDRVQNRESFEEELAIKKDLFEPHVLVSALSKETLEPLSDFLRNWKIKTT